MFMIPLHYLISFSLIYVIWREIFVVEAAQRNKMFIGFLCLLAVQSFLIGTRFGYHVDWILQIQPITASMIPPLAFLSFREKTTLPTGLIHVLPLAVVMLILTFSIHLLDIFLAANNLFYAIALTLIGLKGSDGLGWAEINKIPSLLKTLWLIVILLFSSGIADSIIGIDFWLTGGANTGSIVGNASITILISAIIIAILYGWKRHKEQIVSRPETATLDEEVLSKVDALLKDDKFYLDANLNLNRIARRLALPTREVSRAINIAYGTNISQYVNQLRIEEACRLLANPKSSITETIYASGFNTKSNFNREFVRITGKTPSVWKASN